MSFKSQMEEYLRKNPNATAEESYRAGYMQAVSNWVRQER